MCILRACDLLSSVSHFALCVAEIREVEQWPDLHSVTLGQVAGVAVDSEGNTHVFHRGDRVWDAK